MLFQPIFGVNIPWPKNNNKMRLIILTILFIGLSFAAHAQKLPKVQSIGLRVPAGIKIDGNIGEWGNKFEAYNKATQIF